jgi:hypothetical protein
VPLIGIKNDAACLLFLTNSALFFTNLAASYDFAKDASVSAVVLATV